jgi:hypothetical protein
MIHARLPQSYVPPTPSADKQLDGQLECSEAVLDAQAQHRQGEPLVVLVTPATHRADCSAVTDGLRTRKRTTDADGERVHATRGRGRDAHTRTSTRATHADDEDEREKGANDNELEDYEAVGKGEDKGLDTWRRTTRRDDEGKEFQRKLLMNRRRFSLSARTDQCRSSPTRNLLCRAPDAETDPP